ncbi:mechanosensitive ion channel family protein [Ovoidimarina sediminis]|uniref:mechanosensitive ion channel family protein n=1 Tax=Ovoidimarina sediminis TaxID=3079856 RepID=UPI00290A65B5|nr:mechanosensitive ion channel family protein [Rhodophyticola sp. MJ-SS7]MDU8944292.1 mechanosensitive ion channel family protein [Rhodophyticola sp. MJ-SS7]
MTVDDLAELALVWQGHTRAALEEITALNFVLDGLDGEAAQNTRDQIAEALTRERAIQDSYRTVLDAWELKGAPEDDVAPHRQYLASLAVGVVRTTDIRALIALALEWTVSPSGGLGIFLKIVGFSLALWLLRLAARFVSGFVKRGLARTRKLSRLLRNFVVVAVFWMTFIFGAVLVLGLFGVNVTPLFAILGGVSFILGFALQETLGNFASGLMIMILKPFDTGDYIEVGGSSGVVEDMSIVSTMIRTYDNQIIVVPNSKIWNDVITNVSASPERRVDLVFGVAYSDNANHAIEVLRRLVAEHPKCLKSPTAEIFVGELGDSSVNIFCRPWCKSDDYWTVYWDLTGQAKERFDAEGITIPFPQRELHVVERDVAAELTKKQARIAS